MEEESSRRLGELTEVNRRTGTDGPMGRLKAGLTERLSLRPAPVRVGMAAFSLTPTPAAARFVFLSLRNLSSGSVGHEDLPPSAGCSSSLSLAKPFSFHHLLRLGRRGFPKSTECTGKDAPARLPSFTRKSVRRCSPRIDAGIHPGQDWVAQASSLSRTGKMPVPPGVLATFG